MCPIFLLFKAYLSIKVKACIDVQSRYNGCILGWGGQLNGQSTALHTEGQDSIYSLEMHGPPNISWSLKKHRVQCSPSLNNTDVWATMSLMSMESSPCSLLTPEISWNTHEKQLFRTILFTLQKIKIKDQERSCNLSRETQLILLLMIVLFYSEVS